ncbi:transposase [Celeribacter halophilus]|uniref:Transposase zinc-ribbon domain-containing protein n=2 Tax=Celeribacter halophilus TaxID=576117 RepID=A0A1I3W1C3_9RHOB|nr:transposase [Celeribacter halophilus]PZX06853.1 transposase-like zinc ribbon protein [Celeribacter halophilus]SFK01220.1 Transposase zinc-ribbon domain-containing protein [Celeribacter halophilus]
MDDFATEIHWKSLLLSLPKNGVARHFRTEEDCLRRLCEVQFPNGVTCSKCGSSQLSDLADRHFYHCKDCRFQFSARQGTVFERSNLPLFKWFICAEIAIRAHSAKKLHVSFSISAVMMRLSVSRKTALRLRALVPQELLSSDGGVLGSCVSTQKIDPPRSCEPGTEEHLLWLDSALERQVRL